MPLPALNRRHKAGLFLVLVAIGVSLLLEATAEQAAGVALLGVAVAWGFGSLSLRTLGFLSCSAICATGVGLAGMPLWQDWNSYRALVREYDSAISELREAIAKARPDKWGLYEEYPNGYTVDGRPDTTAILFTNLDTDFGLPKAPEGFVPEPFWVPTKWIDLALTVRKDKKDFKDFMAASAAEQRSYWAHIAADFGSMPQANQDIFLRYVTGKGVDHGPWENYGGMTRNVKTPASVSRWFRPETQETAWTNPLIRFVGDITDTRILTAFESNLRPRPKFSIHGALTSHLSPFLGGVALWLAGLLGNGLLIVRLRKLR